MEYTDRREDLPEPFKFRHLRKIVTAFILLSILIGVLIFIPLQKSQKWFIKRRMYHTYLSRGYNLKEDSPIYIMDIEAGRVEGIELTGNNMVRIDFSIYEDFSKRVGRDSVVIVTTPSILGGKTLEIIPTRGRGGNIAEGDLIYSEDMEEGKRLSEGYVKKSMAKNLEEAVENLKRLSALLSSPEGDFLKGVRGFGMVGGETLPQAGKRLDAILTDLSLITKRLDRAVERMDRFSAMLVSRGSTVGRLVNDDAALYQEIEGSIEKLHSIMKDLKEFSENIKGSSGEVAGLVHKGEKGIDDARRLMGEAERILQGLKKNFFIKRYLKKVEEEEREKARKGAGGGDG